MSRLTAGRGGDWDAVSERLAGLYLESFYGGATLPKSRVLLKIE